MANERGLSSWLTVSPCIKVNFVINFALDIGGLLHFYQPMHWNVHSQWIVPPWSVSAGVFINHAQWTTADLLTEVCHDVHLLPPLQEFLPGVFGVHINSPSLMYGFSILLLSPIKSPQPPARHERDKIKEELWGQSLQCWACHIYSFYFYNCRQYGSSSDCFLQKAGFLILRDWSCSTTLNWIYCRLNFSLLVLRGARSSIHCLIRSNTVSIDLALSEGRAKLSETKISSKLFNLLVLVLLLFHLFCFTLDLITVSVFIKMILYI